MGVLNHLFGSSESVAKEIELDDGAILKKWKDYAETIPKKKKLIESISAASLSVLKELKKLLELELVDISDEEKEESELISDLESIEHSQKIKRVQRLFQCLGYAETKYEHVHGLLHHLHSCLKHQMHLVNKLLSRSKNAKKLTNHLKSQLELELEIIKQVENIKTFHNLFLALVKGEHVIRKMDSFEKRMLKKMDKDAPINGITDKWVMAVFNGIEDKVHEMMSSNILGSHPDVDFEFVNRPEFVDYIKETIKNLRTRKVSEQMINVFVHMFREKYNERD
jgi:hypothetical protein